MWFESPEPTHTTVAGDVLFVMFFAVSEKLQGQGYGSAILDFLKKQNPGKQILLNVEPVDVPAENLPQRQRRMQFYVKNGFYDTGYNIAEVGGTFRVLATTRVLDTRAYLQVFAKISFGLWKPEITKVSGEMPETR